jgi:cytochrome c oxidase subunit 4
MMQQVISVRLCLLIFAALIVLAFANVGLAVSRPGPVYTYVALGIAGCQAFLVIVYFMHIRWSTRLIVIFAAGAFIWLAILVGFTMADFLTRSWLPAPRGW